MLRFSFALPALALLILCASIVALGNRGAAAASIAPTTVRTAGRTLLVNGAPFFIRGVNYTPVPLGFHPGNYDFTLKGAIGERDFPRLRAMGCNAIRTFGQVNSAAFLDAAWHDGKSPLYVVMGFWVDYGADFSRGPVREAIKREFRAYVRRFGRHPAVLMWSVGSEVNYHNGDNPQWYSLLNELALAAHGEEGAGFHPVTTSEGGLRNIGRYAPDVPSLDVWSATVYLGSTFGRTFGEIRSAIAKPFFISEYGRV